MRKYPAINGNNENVYSGIHYDKHIENIMSSSILDTLNLWKDIAYLDASLDISKISVERQHAYGKNGPTLTRPYSKNIFIAYKVSI